MTDSPAISQIPEMKTLPCPICGHSPSVYSGKHGGWLTNNPEVWVASCEVSGDHAFATQGATKSEAVEKWNRRSPSSAQEATPHRCPVCEGLGAVQFNPLMPTSANQASVGPWPCPTCGGTRVIWSSGGPRCECGGVYGSSLLLDHANGCEHELGRSTPSLSRGEAEPTTDTQRLDFLEANEGWNIDTMDHPTLRAAIDAAIRSGSQEGAEAP